MPKYSLSQTGHRGLAGVAAEVIGVAQALPPIIDVRTNWPARCALVEEPEQDGHQDHQGRIGVAVDELVETGGTTACSSRTLNPRFSSGWAQ